MLDAPAQEILVGMDDLCFCETLLVLLQREPMDTLDDPPLRLLWEPWVLQRLHLVRRRASHVYFGVFLSPLRQAFPRLIFPPDIATAMAEVSDASLDGFQGDVPADVFTAAGQAMLIHGLPRGADPGWPAVQALYTVRPGEFTVVTGVASHMKSTWLQNLCVNLARDDWRFGIFSPEHYPLGILAANLLEQYSGHGFMSDTFRLDPAAFVKGMKWVSDHFHVISPPEEVPPSLPWLLATARAQVQLYGIKGLILDPWNEIDHAYGRQTETQYISESLSKVRRFARAHGVHIWLVAHPTKMHKAVGGDYAGLYPPPTPYDISGSAHWYNKADNCLSIWRNVQIDSARIEIHVQKVRNRAVGRPGLAELQYTGRRFASIEEEVSRAPYPDR